MFKRVSSIILYLLFSSQIFAGVSDLLFNHLTTENGLSNNMVHCVFQDSKGFIWIGTDDGLNMFNGYEFTVYKFNSADSTSLSSNSVFEILEDTKGRLWIAASSGVDIFSRESESFHHIPFLEDDLYDRYESYTRAIVEDHKGNILIANTNGIFIYDSVGQGFIWFLKDLANYGTVQQEGIRDLLIDKHNRIWIGSLGSGLFGYDLNKRAIIASPDLREGIRIADKIYTMAEDYNGDIWVGIDNGIYTIKSDLSGLKPFKFKSPAGKPLSDNIRKIYIENKNRIWIGTDGGGIFLYNRNKNTLRNYVQNEFDSYSINHNSVQSIFKDNQGILWLGAYQGELIILRSIAEKSSII